MGHKCYITGSRFLAGDAVELDAADFAALMRAAAAGDLSAQERLCQQYEPKVRIVARVLLGPALRPHFDSLDLVQSVHHSLLVGLRDAKFDISSPEKLIALASTIVRRKVARKWRTLRRQQPVGGRTAEGLAQTLSSLSSPSADPAKAAEFNDQIERLCENLTDVERRMLELRLEGYTSSEVASQLGLHAVALRVRWTRLRKRLQDAGILTDWL
jgi:RNA polymerase sigma-70 factor (ECF subfamily)